MRRFFKGSVLLLVVFGAVCTKTVTGYFNVGALNRISDGVAVIIASQEQEYILAPGESHRYDRVPIQTKVPREVTGPDYAHQCFTIAGRNVRTNATTPSVEV